MSRRTKGNEGPHPVDQHVGHRVRMRRSHLSLSQSSLGDAIGLTFQQIQKYERGANRVSASTLYDISKVLGTSIAYFFEGLTDEDAGKTLPPKVPIEQEIYLSSAEGRRLVEALISMPQAARSKLVALAVALHRRADDAQDGSIDDG